MPGVKKWIRLDTSIWNNPKFLQLREDGEYSAIVLYINGLCYSGEHGLAGFIPAVALPMLGDARRCSTDAQTMLNLCLWDAQKGGWQIHDWDEYQDSGEEAQKRSEHARKAAKARWSARNGEEVI